MRFPKTRFLAGLMVLWLALAVGPARADPADIAATSRSVVRVVLISDNGGEPGLVGHGSGIAIAPDLILTNAHVVEPAREGGNIRIGIVPPQGKGGWFARVVAVAPTADLALIKLTERGALPPATLFTGAVDDGADVFAVGYPGNVDLAQGLNVGDIVSPTSPVKTRGNVSAGRSSKAFETILHTAPIGAGNSGGPLLDPCGRVVGVNSFGTVAGDGDSEFYFAISTREVLRFLRASNAVPHTSGVACRSLADLDRAEAERAAGEKAHSDDTARSNAAKLRDAAEKAERKALLDVIAERESDMALAFLALLLALGAGGGAFVLADKARPQGARIAGGAAGLLVIAAGAAWLLRPGLAEVDARALAQADPGRAAPRPLASGKTPATKPGAGKLACTFDAARSRVTLSDAADIELSWGDEGCVAGAQQFGLDSQGWRQVVVPDGNDSVTVASFDPDTHVYEARRYYPDLDTMAKLHAEKAKLPAPVCGGETAARKLGEAQAALTALLPPNPNERLVYDCDQAKGAN